MLIYLSLFFVLSVLVVGLVVQLLTGGFRNAREREVISSLTVAFDALLREATFAQKIYLPTSVFNTNASQLSLQTSANPPEGESATFVDFYLDNGRVFVKHEGAPSQALTSSRVFVDRFRVEHRTPVTTSESLRIALAAHHRFARAGEDDAFAATTTVTLRRY